MASRNENYMRYVGWGESETPFSKKFFSEITIKNIKEILFIKLKDLRSDGRPIIVADKVITHVMSQIYNQYTPQLGDIYTLLTIPSSEPRNDMKLLMDMVIETIYSNISNEIQMEENNKRLTVWTTVLGDFNEHGLRQHAPIKINEKNINKVRFNMMY
jgi:hypothetical protein